MAKLSPEKQEKKEACEASLEYFIGYIHPKRLLGNVHRELISFICNPDLPKYKIVLLPRDHMKSTMAAYWVVWMLTRNPALRILYISSTANLAVKQLKFIKDILCSDAYRALWPEMVNKEEMLREKWTEKEISVDHPLRKEEAIREPSIFTAGLTTNITGLHCDITVFDDGVVAGNAYTQEGRDKVAEQYGYLSSVQGAVPLELIVGTRYHPNDLYGNLIAREIEEYDDDGNLIGKKPLFAVFERQVETAGDGTGEFLWPRSQRADGKWFGFNQDILREKKRRYDNSLQFRAQYYNDPHDVDSSPIQRDLFQYFDSNYLSQRDGRWYFKGERLNVYAAIDFAYSTARTADYTCVVVVGVDKNNNYYILEIDRFKTDKPSEYFKHILKMYEKWGFRKIRAEVSVAQKVIVTDLKENYIRPMGLSLVVEEFRPSRWQGSKEERMMAVLEPKYANRQIWHYLGGNIQLLEEELLYANPAHDDIKDALSSVIDPEFCFAPTNFYSIKRTNEPVYQYHSKFGGVA